MRSLPLHWTVHWHALQLHHRGGNSSVLPQRHILWQDLVNLYPDQRCHQLSRALVSAVSWVTGIAADGYNGTHMASCLYQMLRNRLHTSLVLVSLSRKNILGNGTKPLFVCLFGQ